MMWEFEQSTKPKISASVPAENSFKQFFTVKHVSTASLVLWSEHCTECGYPDCYGTCDLYEPRFDRHCRTFYYGIHKNNSISTIRSYAAQISPKEWGSCDADVNLFQIPMPFLRFLEIFFAFIASVLKCLSYIFNFISPKKKLLRGWEALRSRLIRRLSNPAEHLPDAFLMQVINCGNIDVSLSFSVANSPRIPGTPFFQKRFTLTPGPHEIIEPFYDIARYIDIREPIRAALSFDRRKKATLLFTAADFVRFTPADKHKFLQVGDTAKTPSIKCVIWDLDDTLWDGVLVEGAEKCRIKMGIVDQIKKLDSRGIVNSIASKNNYNDAIKFLKDNGLDQYFVVPEIGWQPKSESILRIVRLLNIGMDTVAFVDDSDFELKEVNTRLPQITTRHAKQAETLTEDPRFKGSLSADAANRRTFYKNEEKRREARLSSSADYERFLISCHMKITIRRPKDADVNRLHELIQRTNQLNFTGTRYTKEGLIALLEEKQSENFIIECTDDFGDYGTVGFCNVDTRNEVTVREFVLSCRVQARRVDHMFFKHITAYFAERGIKEIKVVFRDTGKNTPARSIFEELRLVEVENAEDHVIFKISASRTQQIIETAKVLMNLTEA